MFSNQDLKKMIVPLFLEQLLVLLVGIIDTFMISSAGEAAVSGVSLVNISARSFCICLRRWHPAARSLSASISAADKKRKPESLPGSC